MKRIPLELLQHVFLLGDLPELPHSPDIYDGPRSYAPAQVCKLWREAAFSHSALWTQITLDEWNSSGKHCMPLPFLEAWLRRSKDRLLDVALHWDEMRGKKRKYAEKQIKLLLLHLSRWHKFSWNYDGDVFNKLIFPHLHKAIAMREMEIEGEGPSTFDEKRILDKHVPFLERFSIHPCPILEFHRIGGDTVTKLFLSETTIKPDELEMLSNDMPNIRELAFEWVECALYLEADDYPKKAFPNVVHFTYDCGDDMPLFEFIVKGTSKLEYLCIKDREYCQGTGLLSEGVLDSLPPTLKSVEIFTRLSENSFDEDEACALKETFRTQLKYLKKLESLEVDFMVTTSDSVGRYRAGFGYVLLSKFPG
jgi:hypothetical protein